MKGFLRCCCYYCCYFTKWNYCTTGTIDWTIVNSIAVVTAVIDATVIIDATATAATIVAAVTTEDTAAIESVIETSGSWFEMWFDLAADVPITAAVDDEE